MTHSHMNSEHAPVMQCRSVSKFFPGAIALDAVDLDLYAGEVHALLGENGAGKSTLIKCLTGAYSRDDGDIMLDGQPINPRDTEHSQTLGVGTVYQEVNLLQNLTVAENLFLGRQPTRFGLVDYRKMNELARQKLAEFGLKINPTELLSSYSVAIQQIVAIARAVDLSGRVLILDEPTASLDREEVNLLFTVVRELKKRGLAIVFITHFLDQVFEICDRATILRNGQVVETLELAGVSRTEVVSLMLGRQLEAHVARDKSADQIGDVMISLKSFGKSGSVAPFDLDIHASEVVGIAGLLGSGRTETAELLFGVERHDSGTIEVNGKPANLSSPRSAIALRFGMCPEDRKVDGIVGDLSVRENIGLALQARKGWLNPLTKSQLDELANHYVKALDIRLANLDMPIRLLSGGNQQKALLARWLATEPQFLILDEPTRGIDVGAHAEIVKLIETLREQGMALLVVSSEIEELVAYSTKINVMRDRAFVGSLSGQDISPSNIVKAIAGEEVDQTDAREVN